MGLKLFGQQIYVLFKSVLKVVGLGGFACATRGDVAMRSWPLLLPTFVFGPGGFACATGCGVHNA